MAFGMPTARNVIGAIGHQEKNLDGILETPLRSVPTWQ
jgi:hypothetical protein